MRNTQAGQGRKQSREVWEQIRAAWNYINQKDSVEKYDEVAVELIKDRIKQSAATRGLKLRDFTR